MSRYQLLAITELISLSLSDNCDSYCIGLNGPSSWCKTDLTVPVCFGGDQPCSICHTTIPMTTINPIDQCNNYCASISANSYCKNWLNPPVCQDNNAPCSTSICYANVPFTTTNFETSKQFSTTNGYQTTTPKTTTTRSTKTTKTTTTLPTTIKSSTTLTSTVTTSTTKSTMTTSSSTTTLPTTTISTTKTSTSNNVATTISANCDSYCFNLNNMGYCKNWDVVPVCLGGNQPCNNNICSSYTTTTTTTTTLPPVTISSFNYTNNSIPMFLWIEAPISIPQTFSAMSVYYTGILNFVKSNCANIATTKLLIRTISPYWPNGGPALFWPPQTSPLYTNLISLLPSNVQVIIYPYIMEDTDRLLWINFLGGPSVSTDPLQGVYSFVSQWNSFLASKNINPIVGIVLDREEAIKQPTYQVDLTAPHISKMRTMYPGITMATTIGFDEIGVANNFASSGALDGGLYIELYDFYYPAPRADSSNSSVWLTHMNDPVTLANLLVTNLVPSSVWTAYNSIKTIYPNFQMHAMWSNQNLGISNCIAPVNGICGLNFEFGNWSPSAFNQFVQIVQSKNSALAWMDHGIFQYNFFTPQWINNC